MKKPKPLPVTRWTYPNNSKLELLWPFNPKSPMSPSAERYELYHQCKTVGDYRELMRQGGKPHFANLDLGRDQARGFIKLTSTNPEVIEALTPKHLDESRVAKARAARWPDTLDIATCGKLRAEGFEFAVVDDEHHIISRHKRMDAAYAVRGGNTVIELMEYEAGLIQHQKDLQDEWETNHEAEIEVPWAPGTFAPRWMVEEIAQDQWFEENIQSLADIGPRPL